MKDETRFRNNSVNPFLKKLKNTFAVSIQQKNKAGTPDILLCCKGTFVGLELKTDLGKVSPIQNVILTRIRRSHGVGLVARPNNWKFIKDILIRLDNGEKYDYPEVSSNQPTAPTSGCGETNPTDQQQSCITLPDCES